MPERMQRPDVERVGQLAASGEGFRVTGGLKAALEADSRTSRRQHRVWSQNEGPNGFHRAPKAPGHRADGLLCSSERRSSSPEQKEELVK